MDSQFFRKYLDLIAEAEQPVGEELQDIDPDAHKIYALQAKAAGDMIGYHNHMGHYYRREASVLKSDARELDYSGYDDVSREGRRAKKLRDRAQAYLEKAQAHHAKVTKLGGKVSSHKTSIDPIGDREYAASVTRDTTGNIPFKSYT